MSRFVLRSLVALAGVAFITVAGRSLVAVNATTVGFAYLLLVLGIASTWGMIEASVASLAATIVFNYFFFPPFGTLTIADPQNWVALFSFLATSLIASRLSAEAKRRALDAVERQQDVERLYTFSRSILLIDGSEPFPKQLIQKLASIFELKSAVLYERRAGEIYRAGPSDFEGLDEQLREAALNGTFFSDAEQNRAITAVRLGSEPIASLGLEGARMQDSVLQGIANLTAIGLERARAQDLAHQIEASRQSEQLRSTLIDAMAHELKTPLTSIKAATTSLLASPDQPPESRMELLKIAGEEVERLQDLIDDAVEMARLDTTQIDVQLEVSDLGEAIQEVVESMETDVDIEDRRLTAVLDKPLLRIPFDRRLMKLAVKQLLDNALKYSPPGTPVTIRVQQGEGRATLDITDHGAGIPAAEQGRIFERFYRSPSVRQQIPGSGLGLSIAHRIARAHNGDLSLMSRPGETTFRLTLPEDAKEVGIERGPHSGG